MLSGSSGLGCRAGVAPGTQALAAVTGAPRCLPVFRWRWRRLAGRAWFTMPAPIAFLTPSMTGAVGVPQRDAGGRGQRVELQAVVPEPRQRRALDFGGHQGLAGGGGAGGVPQRLLLRGIESRKRLPADDEDVELPEVAGIGEVFLVLVIALGVDDGVGQFETVGVALRERRGHVADLHGDRTGAIALNAAAWVAISSTRS